MPASKGKVIKSFVFGKAASVIGYISALTSLLFLAVTIDLFANQRDSSGGTVGIFMTIIFMGIGAYGIITGVVIKKQIKRFRKYINLISLHNITSLDKIASAANRTPDFVSKDLQRMIDKKFFANAIIDYASGKIIIGSKGQRLVMPSVQPEMETFTCRVCLATGIKPKGVPVFCEYCDTAVS